MNFTFSAKETTIPFHHHWKFCVGSGHAGLAMRTDYVEQLRYIHSELGIERVRFHGIFCDDIHTRHHLADIFPVPFGSKFQEQSFRLAGLIYDNVLSCGMKPFVELSFMPKIMSAKQKQGVFFYKPVIDLPKSEAEWTAYIQDFIRFLLRRYGAEEVRTWYFEVWNEPDLRISFFNGTQADYFRLYELTVRAIRSVDDHLKVGGPATSGCHWIREFLAYCQEKNIPVDFISTHQYAGDPLGGVDADKPSNPRPSVLALIKKFKNAPAGTVLDGYRLLMEDETETKNLPDNVFRHNVRQTKEITGDLPLYITEWNMCAVFSAYSNDTRKAAAYIVKAALDTEPWLAGSSVWCFSDIFEELHPFPEEFHGGFGLLSQHGIPKPTFYALKLLGQLSKNRIALDDEIFMRGEVSLAAFKAENGIQVLLTRQKMKQEDLPDERVTITIQDCIAPKSITAYRISKDSCNPLKIWEDMGSTLDLTPHEVEEIKSKSQMEGFSLPFTAQNGSVSVEVSMGVNDVLFFHLETQS